MLDKAAEGSPNTPKYRRSEKGQKIPSQSGLDGIGRATYTQTQRVGEGHGHKEVSLLLGVQSWGW